MVKLSTELLNFDQLVAAGSSRSDAAAVVASGDNDSRFPDALVSYTTLIGAGRSAQEALATVSSNYGYPAENAPQALIEASARITPWYLKRPVQIFIAGVTGLGIVGLLFAVQKKKRK